MAFDSARPSRIAIPDVRIVVITVTAALMLGACAQNGDGAASTSLLGSPVTNVANAEGGADKAPDNRSDLEKATDYWGKKYREKPTDKTAGLSYAKNLRAMGEKRQALAVLQQMAMFYASDREVASEYGRLALEHDQLSIAKQMLAVADDPGNPDWRVISARGTVLAKEGKFGEATPLFERAMTLAPTEPAVMNNLAMAYAMGGEADKAEDMLRKIETSGGTANPKIRQNLALVLGLQGKFDESKSVAMETIGKEGAQANANLLRQFVKAAPVASAAPAAAKGAPAVAGWSATASEVKQAAPAKAKPKKTAAPANDAYVPPAPGGAPELTTPAADNSHRGRAE